MDERFTDRARKVMKCAHEEAKRLQHDYIGTEHILLGLLKEGNGVAAYVLKSLDYDLSKIQIDVEKCIESVRKRVVTKKWLPYTPRAKKVIEYAIDEVISANDNYVGTEHLLLGILRETECVAAIVLARNYLTVDKVRREISRLEDRAEREKIHRDDCDRRGTHDIPSFISHILAKIRQGIRFSKPEKRDEATTAHQHASYEHFTDRARSVMQLANQEAKRLHHEFVETEHILLGLTKEGSGLAASVLTRLGGDLQRIRTEVEKIIQAGPDMVTTGKLPHTPDAKKAIEYAIEEARVFNHNYIGTEHLLLGILRDETTPVFRLLQNHGISLEKTRHSIMELLNG